MTTLFSIPFHSTVKKIKGDFSNIAALYKPAGIMMHPNLPGICKTALLQAEYDEEQEMYYWDEGKQHLYLIHRLDSPTSGVVIVTQNFDIAQELRKAFADRKIQKKYHAIIKGFQMRPPAGIWQDHISKTKFHEDYARSIVDNKGNLAESAFRWIRSDSKRLNLSLIELSPKTGMTHQLRVQCAKHHYPILGDKTYGDFTFNKKIKTLTQFNRLALHASRIEINLPNKLIFCAESPIPQEFTTLLGK